MIKIFFNNETDKSLQSSNECKNKSWPAERKGAPVVKEQLGELILTSQDTLYRVSKTILKNDTDCADAISETIVKAFSKIHTLKQDNYAKTWLIRILINECYSILRQKKKLVSLEDYTLKEPASQEKEDYSELYEAISRLPEKIPTCVTLYYMEEFSVKEIAVIMDITESAVKNRLARARAKLKEELTALEVME